MAGRLVDSGIKRVYDFGGVMTFTSPYTPEFKAQIVSLLMGGRSKKSLMREYGLHQNTLNKWLGSRHPPPNEKRETPHSPLPILSNEKNIQTPPPTASKKPRILYVDTEVLPNMGFFYDTYNDKRAIPLDFIVKQKAIITIQYAFDDDDPTVLIAEKAYDDRDILEQFLPIYEQADIIVWHHGEAFDRKVINARLFANRLPSLAPKQSEDTCKMARAKFGKTLNSNSLDHIAKICGIEGKLHIHADTWAKVALGDRSALLNDVVPYGARDIVVLRNIYKAMIGNIDSKVNHNLYTDSPTLLCKPCGSDSLRYIGQEFKAATFRHTYQCNQCMAYSTFPRGKT